MSEEIKEGDLLQNAFTGNKFRVTAFQANFYNRKKFGFIRKASITDYEYVKALISKIMLDRGKTYSYSEAIEIIKNYENQNT